MLDLILCVAFGWFARGLYTTVKNKRYFFFLSKKS